MFINEYGDKNDPLVLLLAPMMVSGEDLYQLMHPFFKHEYHYIAPDQGGHGKAGAYISADEEYKTLKRFLLDEGYREIELVYGASLGVAIGYRLFLDPDITVHHVWFDGVALSRNKIVVLSEGKVAEEGSPAELFAKEDSLFRRMTQLQNASAGWSIK